MSAYELAQLNIGIIKGPMDSPVMSAFAANLERINALADQAPGFVWRLQTAAGDATALRPFTDPSRLVNLSVWRDAEALRRFVYQSAHAEIMRRRREWFERMASAYMVLWWVPRGQRPTVAEAIARLEALHSQGAHAQAFTFRQLFAPPDAAPSRAPDGCSDPCPAT
jgi:heme-degrading monooxygenase HmoA